LYKFAERYSFFLHTSHLRPCCFALKENMPPGCFERCLQKTT
jgi:hypothetical protein